MTILGVPIDATSQIMVNNDQVVNNFWILSITVNNKQHSIVFQPLRSYVDMGMINLSHKTGKSNPYDILTKPLSTNQN